MPPPVIDNPILNGPFDEPSRHFEFNDQGITDRIATGRRASGYFLPIASARKKSGQIKFDTEWTQDRFLSSPRINPICSSRKRKYSPLSILTPAGKSGSPPSASSI